jgi:hypothetical protein
VKFNSDTFLHGLRGRRGFGRYDFPGIEDAKCGIRLLLDEELDEGRIEAVAYCKERKADLTWDAEFFDRELKRQAIFRAYVDPDSDPDLPEKFFEDIDDIRKLDTVLVLELYELYISHQQLADPFKFVSREEVDVFVEQLGKPGTTERGLTLCDRRTLLSYALSMACVLREMRAQPSSSTTSTA